MVSRDGDRCSGRWRNLPITLHRAMLPTSQMPVLTGAISPDQLTIGPCPKLVSIRLRLRYGRHYWLDDPDNHPCWTELK